LKVAVRQDYGVDSRSSHDHEAAKKPTAALSFQTPGNSDKTASRVERLPARAPKTLRLDKAGFFVVLPQAATGLIICEHYENSGRLAHVIEGRKAAVIAATVIEQGLLTQLDHAAYLGRELTKAEIALNTGSHYEQDAALGILPSKKSQSTEACEMLKGVRLAVIDEIHAFAGDDRGWHLLAVLERISRLAGRELQRIGLSATVGNPEELLEWMAGHCEGSKRVLNPQTQASAAETDVRLDYVGSLQNAAEKSA